MAGITLRCIIQVYCSKQKFRIQLDASNVNEAQDSGTHPRNLPFEYNFHKSAEISSTVPILKPSLKRPLNDLQNKNSELNNKRRKQNFLTTMKRSSNIPFFCNNINFKSLRNCQEQRTVDMRKKTLVQVQ